MYSVIMRFLYAFLLLLFVNSALADAPPKKLHPPLQLAEMTLKDYLPWIPDEKTFHEQDKEVKDLFSGVFQNNSLSGPQSTSGSQEEFLYSDRFGNKYTASEINFNSAGGGGCPNSGYFDLDFGPGFTADEITTICQVFIDVSALFTSQQSDIPILVNRENMDEGVFAAASGLWRADIPSGGVRN